MRHILAILVTLLAAVASADDYPQRAQDATIVETVLRLEGFDIDSSEKAKAAVTRYLQHNAGSERFFDLVRKYDIPEARPLLVKLAAERSTETAGVNAARLLIESGRMKLLEDAIAGDDAAAAGVATAMGLAGRKEVVDILQPLMLDAKRPLAVRSAAAAAIGRQVGGPKLLLDLAAGERLPDDLHFTAGNVLRGSPDAAIRQAAQKHLRLPATANAEPLPPLAELVKQDGDAKVGQTVYTTKGTCNKCHKVRGEGKEIGPDLSEIGSKLTREAMFVAILDPSAGISHNYESYQAIMDDGTVFVGIKLSETDDAVTLRSAEGIERTIAKDRLEEIFKQQLSLMPADLQKLMTADELVNVVAFLSTLKKQGE